MVNEVLNKKSILEKYSSAFTLSDMEVFIFPELIYALVLANILSPRIWAWKKNPWFADIKKLSFNRQVQRLKQYIMDHYSFNLDLKTWGLTTKPKELARFADFVDPELFIHSNALFGYEGDKYYFDLDIRRHFGLDKYQDDVIPYWKTETVEAMDAFEHKAGFTRGAGECVSLATLYATALFIVLEIPLEDIFVMATPLHSQTFVASPQGKIITNNRRILTKTMWFNGSELTSKARRALEKERVILVANNSGFVHIEYPEATMDPADFQRFNQELSSFLISQVDFEIFSNFLRVHPEYRNNFQFEYKSQGRQYYIPATRLYKYEHDSQVRVGDRSWKKLLDEIELEEFETQPDPQQYILNLIEKKLNDQPLRCNKKEKTGALKNILAGMPDLENFCKKMSAFTCSNPKLPSSDKKFLPSKRIHILPSMSRSDIIGYLKAQRAENTLVDMAFYAYREIDDRGWQPFLKACLERNTAAIKHFQEMKIPAVFQSLREYADASIYDDDRWATPDEVINFKRGDGWEKAICLMNIIRERDPQRTFNLAAETGWVHLDSGQQRFSFPSLRKMSFTPDPQILLA